MNTKIYKAVYGLSEKLMEAAKKEDVEGFDSLYLELNTICVENDNTDKDHPEQWETLADFTEDLEGAVALYEKALAKAVAIDSKDHISSITYSMAVLQVQLGKTDDAIKQLQLGKVSATKIVDDELKAEIDALLEELSPTT